MSRKRSDGVSKKTLWLILLPVLAVVVVLRLFVVGSYYVESSNTVRSNSLVLVSFLSKPTQPGDIALVTITGNNGATLDLPAKVQSYTTNPSPAYKVTLDQVEYMDVAVDQIRGKVILVLPFR